MNSSLSRVSVVIHISKEVLKHPDAPHLKKSEADRNERPSEARPNDGHPFFNPGWMDFVSKWPGPLQQVVLNWWSTRLWVTQQLPEGTQEASVGVTWIELTPDFELEQA